MIQARGGGLRMSTFDGCVYRYSGGSVTADSTPALPFSLSSKTPRTLWASTRKGVLRTDEDSLLRAEGLADMAWNVLADRDGDRHGSASAEPAGAARPESAAVCPAGLHPIAFLFIRTLKRRKE